MANPINNILQHLFRVKISKAKKSIVHQTFKTPLLIELAGVKGVGKTTLLGQMKKTNKGGWMNFHHFRKLHFSQKHKEILDDLPVYQYLAQKQIDYVLRDFKEPSVQLGRFSFYNSVLINDALCQLLNKKYLIISDEGLVDIMGPSVKMLSKDDPAGFEALLKNRAFIYCHAPVEQVAKQILKRIEATGRVNYDFKNKSFEELVAYTEDSLDFKTEFMTMLKSKGVPVLDIDTTENINENVRKIDEFIIKLQQRL